MQCSKGNLKVYKKIWKIVRGFRSRRHCGLWFGIVWCWRSIYCFCFFTVHEHSYRTCNGDPQKSNKEGKTEFWSAPAQWPGAPVYITEICRFLQVPGSYPEHEQSRMPLWSCSNGTVLKTFKEEQVYRNPFMNTKELDDGVAQYVFVWYNHVRTHSYNNWLTPLEARKM